MRTYRIAKKEYIEDLSRDGSRLYGGRWNPKGISILYTASNRSLATVECLAQLSFFMLLSERMYIAEIDIPDDLDIDIINQKDLPPDWSSYPAPLSLAKIGQKWANQNKTLAMKVPSAIVENEWNILINPLHQDFDKVKIITIEPYVFNQRLFNK